MKSKQGEGCETKRSLWRTKSLGVLPLVLLYVLAHESAGSVLVEVVQGCRGSCSGWTDYRNIKPANARGSPCTIVASSPCRGLVLLSRSVLLAERSSCCGEDREKETHTHCRSPPHHPSTLTNPPNNNLTKKGTSRVEKEKKFMVFWQEGECWQGGQWKPQAGWAICGGAEQQSGYSGQMGGLLEPFLGRHSAGAPLDTLPWCHQPFVQYLCCLSPLKPSLNERLLRMDVLLVSGNHGFTEKTQWLLQPSHPHI